MTHPILENWSEISAHPAPALFQPESELDLQQFLRAGGEPCLLAGNGSKWWMGNPPLPARHCVDLRCFDRVIEYSPGDLTVTVQAGTPFSRLQETLASEMQTLPVDPPLARSATIGGMVAVGLSGPLQQSHGTLRDKVLGVKVIHPDGTVTRAGGKVVKNVAGYDLCKLYCGSFGTLVTLLEVTLRVFPSAESIRCFVLSVGSFDQACETWETVRRLPVNPSGIVYLEEQYSRGQVVMRLRGTARSIEAQLAEMHAAFPGGRTETEDIVEKSIEQFYSSKAPVWLRLETLPGSLKHTVPLLQQQMEQRTLVVDFSSRRCHFSTLVASTDSLKRLRSSLQQASAALVLEKAPLSIKQQIEVWGSRRGDMFLAGKIKAALDPGQRFNPGRYVAGS